MALRFYNTLTRRKDVFKPLKGNSVRMYSCGPTVYNYVHIGNLRSFIFVDLLRRYLRYRGYTLKHVMNITDVDDKTIRNSRKQGKTLKEFTRFYTKAFLEDLRILNIEIPETMPLATAEIKGMVGLVKKLLDKGYAYKAEDGIYFSISKFPGYGKLAGLDLKQLKAGASGRVRADEYDKENVHDFVLWKFWDKDDGDVFWATDIGKGRPGWHIECSVMSSKYLGQPFDIHTGGVDLIFPHHTNEIAQSEAATGKEFVKFWIHNAHLIVNGQKMSKSLGNYYTLRDLKKHNPISMRYVLLATHYRQKLDFSETAVKKADNTLKRFYDFMAELREVKGKGKYTCKLCDATRKGFEKAMDDDLNISEALAVIFDMMNKVNKAIAEKKITEGCAKSVYDMMLDFDKVLGLKLGEQDTWGSAKDASKEIRELIERREKYRKEKNWAEADKLRDKLKKMKVTVQDTDSGPRWRKG